MPLQGEKYSELFSMFLELHKRGGAKDDKARAIPYFFTFWVPCQHPHPIEKQSLKR